MATNLPDPIAVAHTVLAHKLAAIKPPSLSGPTPGEFAEVAEYIEAVACILDDWHRRVGQEVAANSTLCVNKDCFADAFRGATEGFSVFEVQRAADALREENADYAADPRGHAKADRLGVG